LDQYENTKIWGTSMIDMKLRPIWRTNTQKLFKSTYRGQLI